VGISTRQQKEQDDGWFVAGPWTGGRSWCGSDGIPDGSPARIRGGSGIGHHWIRGIERITWPVKSSLVVLCETLD
jgi:hypothetical protein